MSEDICAVATAPPANMTEEERSAIYGPIRAFINAMVEVNTDHSAMISALHPTHMVASRIVDEIVAAPLMALLWRRAAEGRGWREEATRQALFAAGMTGHIHDLQEAVAAIVPLARASVVHTETCLGLMDMGAACVCDFDARERPILDALKCIRSPTSRARDQAPAAGSNPSPTTRQDQR